MLAAEKLYNWCKSQGDYGRMMAYKRSGPGRRSITQNMPIP